MKILVLGANGFLGRNLVKRCLEQQWEVECVFHNHKSHIPKQCASFHITKLEERTDDYDIIFLLAAFIPYGNFNSIDKRLIDTNIKIPLLLIEKFKKAKIVFSSSTSVYGNHSSVIFEDSSFNNPTTYGFSKLSAEFLLKFHPKYQIVRFSSIYGKGMFAKTFVPKIIKEAKRNKRITLWGDGSRLQNYVFIEDALDYLFAAAQREESGIYLGIGDKSYSNTEVAKIIQKFIPDCKIKYKGEDNNPSFVYNSASTKKLLGFVPKFSLEAGIKRMLEK